LTAVSEVMPAKWKSQARVRAFGVSVPRACARILDMTPQGRGTDWYPKLSY
jgi:hypothetical protein